MALRAWGGRALLTGFDGGGRRQDPLARQLDDRGVLALAGERGRFDHTGASDRQRLVVVINGAPDSNDTAAATGSAGAGSEPAIQARARIHPHYVKRRCESS
jgi:hypothetical protein